MRRLIASFALTQALLFAPLSLAQQQGGGGGSGGGGGGSGTVTSLAPAAGNCIAVSPNPITTSGTIDLGSGTSCALPNGWTATTQAANNNSTKIATTAYADRAAAAGGNTLTLTADTNITAGTAVFENTAGHAVQSGMPAPEVASTTTVYSGLSWNNLGQSQGVNPILKLDADDFVAFGFFAGGAKVGTISGSSIAFGALNTAVPLANVVAASTSPGLAVPTAATLSPSLFITVYNDPTSGFATVAACAVSGDTITGCSSVPAQLASQGLKGQGSVIAVDLDATHFALMYLLADGSLNGVVGSVLTGTNVVLGTSIQLTASGQNGTDGSLVVTSSTSVAFVYSDNANSSFATVTAATISGGTVLTPGSPVAIESTPNSTGVSGAALTSTLLVVAWPTETTYQVLAEAVTISGTVVTPGGSVVPLGMNTGELSQVVVRDLDSSHALVFSPFEHNLGPQVVAVSGTTVTPDVPPILSPNILVPNGFIGLSPAADVAMLSSGEYMFVDSQANIYQGDSSGNISGRIAHPSFQMYWLYPIDSTHALASFVTAGLDFQVRVIDAAANIALGPVGFAPPSGCTAAASCAVVQAGVVRGFTSLPVGPEYLIGNGSLVQANTGHFAGYGVCDVGATCTGSAPNVVTDSLAIAPSPQPVQ